MQPTLKILISYHKKAILLKNDIFVPIQLGRAVNNKISKDGVLSKEEIDWFTQNMIGDDTGDNISNLNRYLCENTALYWAWKNYNKLGNPDYIGFMHYRRHLVFNQTKISKKQKLHKWYKLYCFEHFYDLYKNNEYLNLTQYLSDLSNYDIINSNIIHLDRPVSKELIVASETYNLDKHICQKVFDTIRIKKSEYKKALELNLNSNNHYWYNCFIMKKELFFEYAQFLFDVLLDVNKEINYEKYQINEQRVLAYMSERLLGIFITQKTIIESKKIKYLPLAFIKNPDLYKRNFFQKTDLIFNKTLKTFKKFIYQLKQIKNIDDTKALIYKIFKRIYAIILNI